MSNDPQIVRRFMDSVQKRHIAPAISSAVAIVTGTATNIADWLAEHVVLPAALGVLGHVKPDGTTTTVDVDGTIHATGGGTSVTGTAPISVSGGAVSISAATTSAAGSLSAADKTKIDQLVMTALKILSVTGTITITPAADGYTLTIPGTGEVARRNVSETFTKAVNLNTGGAGTNYFNAGPFAALVLGTDGAGDYSGGLMATPRNTAGRRPFVAFCGYDVDGLDRALFFGGGGWGTVDATSHNFYCAPTYNETIDTGVPVVRIDKDGLLAYDKLRTNKQIEIMETTGVNPLSTDSAMLYVKANGTGNGLWLRYRSASNTWIDVKLGGI